MFCQNLDFFFTFSACSFLAGLLVFPPLPNLCTIWGKQLNELFPFFSLRKGNKCSSFPFSSAAAYFLIASSLQSCLNLLLYLDSWAWTLYSQPLPHKFCGITTPRQPSCLLPASFQTAFLIGSCKLIGRWIILVWKLNKQGWEGSSTGAYKLLRQSVLPQIWLQVWLCSHPQGSFHYFKISWGFTQVPLVTTD